MKKLSLFLSALLISLMGFAQEAWLLVTDASELAAGDQVVVVAKDYNVALSTNQKNNNRGEVAITKEGSEVIINNDVQILTIATGKQSGTFALYTGTGYLYAASSSNNYLRTESTLSDNSSWKITIEASGNASVVAQGTNTRNVMQYNQPSTLFACYASTTQKPITIYKKVNAEGIVKNPAIEGEESFKESTQVSISYDSALEVYYTIDGTDPTKASTRYTAPFTITETTTVKAIAFDGDKPSDIIEKTFIKMTIYTCAEAAALCTATATTEKYIIHGYVTEIKEAYNTQYGNITFWMADTKNGGQVLQAYRAKPVSEVEKNLQVGDYVEVIGTLVLYYSTPEVNAGCSVEKIAEPGTSSIDNVIVNKQVTKFFENGQLVIIKDGIRYNAQGQVL